MKRFRTRHVHAAPNEHVRVHRHSTIAPTRSTGLVPWVVEVLGPLGTVVAIGLAMWGAFELFVFILDLVVSALKVITVLAAVYVGILFFSRS